MKTPSFPDAAGYYSKVGKTAFSVIAGEFSNKPESNR